MRPTGVEPATFGLKDRRSLGPRKDPLTTELRALGMNCTRASFTEAPGHRWPEPSSPAPQAGLVALVGSE